MSDPHAALAAAPVKKGGRTLSYFTHRQGHAIPFSILLALFFLFWNPHATTPTQMAFWAYVPMVLIFGWYLAITQVLPVVTAPMFESHFAAAKDFGSSIALPIAVGVMSLLSLTMGTVEVFGHPLDIDMTWIEIGIAAQAIIAFGIDAEGSIFTLIKNRMASEEGMGRIPGAQ